MKTLFLAVLLSSFAAFADAAVTKLTWHGHAAFELVTPKGAVLFVDPWLKNPLNPKKDPLSGVKKADYILVSHGHIDHVGDSVELAKKTKAKLVSTPELARAMSALMGFPASQVGYDTMGNAGGELKLADGEVVVQFTPAVHASGLDLGDGKPAAYGGNALGFLIKVKDGPTIYHSGDTAFFKDMEQLAAADVDVALLNIGGHFGMEPEGAAMAARVINPKLVVPHHYKTMPILTQDASAFAKELEADKIPMRELQPGDTLEFEGREPKK